MNKNKILTAVMAGTMMMGSVLPVCAATTESQNVGQTEADAGTTRNTEVLYTQTSTFTVTIPKQIVLGETKASDYTVNVKGDISSDKQDVTVWSSADVCKTDGTDKAGNVSAQDLTSGSWAGTFEFSIALEAAE